MANYTLQIDDDPAFLSPVLSTDVAPALFTAPPLGAGLFNWRVRANYDAPPGSTAGWSQVWRFLVPIAPPTDVNARLVTGMSDVRITWNASIPESLVNHYEVWRGFAYDPARSGYGKVSADLPPGTLTWTDVGAGDSPFDYFYSVRALNWTGFPADSPGQVAKFHRDIPASRPYLLSLPVRNESALPGENFGGTATWTRARVYRTWNTSDPWRAYDRGRGYNELVEFNLGDGIWIHASTTGDFRVAGRVPCAVTIALRAGWNLVGFPSMTPRTAGTAAAGLGALGVEGYDASQGPYFLRRLSGADLMRPTEGYWIRMPADRLWTIVNDPALSCA